MAAPRKYPQELRDRAIRLAKGSDRPLAHIAGDLGVHPEALRNWVRQDEAERGERADQLSTAERDEFEAATGGEHGAASGQRNPEGGERHFRGRSRPSPDEVIAVVEQCGDRVGVEPICRVLGYRSASTASMTTSAPSAPS